MDVKNVEKFYQSLVQSDHFNEDLKSKLQNVHDEKEYKIFIKDELLPLAKSMGYDLEVDDILSYDQWKVKNLSESELENIVGGKNFLRNSAITFVSFLSMVSGATALQAFNTASAMMSSASTSMSTSDYTLAETQNQIVDFCKNHGGEVDVASGTIDLSHRLLDDEALSNLVNFLKHDSTFRVLNLADCRIDDKGAQKIAELLQDNKTLVSLNLSNMETNAEYVAINERIYGAMGSYSMDFISSLQEEAAGMQPHGISSAGARLLAKALETNDTLESLDLSGNVITSYDFFVQALEKNATLTELNLNFNLISSVGNFEDEVQKVNAKVNISVEGNANLSTLD